MRCPLLAVVIPLALFSSAVRGAEALRPWKEYRAIMWLGESARKDAARFPLVVERLREMNINTGMAYGDGSAQPLMENHLPYYVENVINRGLCLKWSSKVVDWDKFVTEWAKNGRPDEALVRDYCLDDPQWRDWARKQMERVARQNRENSPVAYNIRDELSTTISANPFDYDFSPVALAAFRAWLRTQYADLSALNTEWQTAFENWDEVKPFTTDQIKNRMATGEAMPRGKPDWAAIQQLKFEPARARQSPAGWNFAPWADFRTYMDLSLARALDDLRRAAHESDPRTPVGIEGTQMPDAFGGYDLWRLSQVLDWVEPYDIGNAREIFGSFMPGKPLLTTVFENTTNPARRRLWHLLLEGDRGCIIWWSEDCIDWKSKDYRLTPKALALSPVLKEMASPLAALFMNAKREHDPVFIHYSQPSIQVDWLLESTVDGSTWLRRFSSFEAEHNRMAKSRNGWLKVLQDLGYSPVFVSSEQVETGALNGTSNAVLVLANTWAMSSREAAAVRRFLDDSGSEHTIFCEGTPGLFDEHARLLPRAALENLVPLSGTEVFAVGKGGSAARTTSGGARYAAARLGGNIDWADWIRQYLPDLRAPVTVRTDARVRIHRFHAGSTRLLAFERNIDYHMSEDLKQAGGNEALEKPVEVDAVLPEAAHVYDLRSNEYLGHSDHIRFTLDPWQPSLFAVSSSKLPEGQVVEELRNMER